MFFVRVLDFKCNIPGASTVNEDGTYTIFINSRLSFDKQQDAFIHEMYHIMNNDFNLNSVCEAELGNDKFKGGLYENI